MAPPPAPGTAPYPGPFGPIPPGGPPVRPRGPLLAVVVIVVLALVAAAGVVLVLAVRDGDGGDGDADAMVVDLVAAQRDLLGAIEYERNLAVFDLMGMTDLVSLPVDDPEEVRRSTDEAIAAFLPLVEAGPAAPAYRTALEQLGGLAEVRSSVDGYSGPRTLATADTADEAYASYSLVIDGLIDAQGELAPTIDDPDLWAGVEVHHLGLRQQELTVRLVRATVMNAVLPGDPARLTAASAIYEQLRQGRDDLTAAAAGTPYEDAAVQALADVDAAGAVDLMGQALEGSVDIEALLDAVVVDPDQGWFAFLPRVEAILANAG